MQWCDTFDEVKMIVLNLLLAVQVRLPHNGVEMLRLVAGIPANINCLCTVHHGGLCTFCTGITVTVDMRLCGIGRFCFLDGISGLVEVRMRC